MSKTIVLIDDDPGDLNMMKSAIKKSDQSIHCISFLYPEEAVRVITMQLVNPPDFIVVDMNMPGKNGMECLQEFRKKTHLQKVPVIIYSSRVRPEVREALLEAGANFVFEKPDYRGWSSVVKKILENNWLLLLYLRPI